MVYRLPPLNALRLFEAAGRHSSFKRAAEEMSLTPSAVSHAVRSLEEWLDTELFVRNHGGIVLTEFGQSYLAEIQGALDRIAAATEARPRRGRVRPLSCSVAPTFALRWLLPRLSAFRDSHPEIEIAIDTSHEPVTFAGGAFDVAIRMAPMDAPEELAYPLVTQQLIPVAAPALAARLQQPADLCGHTLLHVSTVSEDWDTWLKVSGAELPGDCRHLYFDRIHLALDAAERGLGVAIGRLPLVACAIDSGALVPLFGPPQPCRTAYWLIISEAALGHPGVQAFKKWIQKELAGSVAGFGRDPDRH